MAHNDVGSCQRIGCQVGRGRLAAERIGVSRFQCVRDRHEQNARRIFQSRNIGTNCEPAGCTCAEQILRQAAGVSGTKKDGVVALCIGLNGLEFRP